MPDTKLVLLFAAVWLILALAAGLVRALLGPTLEDRMLSVQLLGTGGVGLLLMLAMILDSTALIDVALVTAMLAAVAAAALTQRESPDD